MNWRRQLSSAMFVALFATFLAMFFLTGLGRCGAIPSDTAESILEREIAVAESIGFEVSRSGSVDYRSDWMSSDNWQFEASLEAGECVALVVATEGDQHPTRIVLDNEEGAHLATDEGLSRYAAHVQWCAEVAQTVRSTIDFEAVFFMGHTSPGESRAFTLHFRELRARAADVGGRAGLNRGWVLIEDPSAATEDG